MARKFILVSSPDLTVWPQIVRVALADLGEVEIVPENDVIEGHIQLDCSTVTILDETVTSQLSTLISALKAQCPHMLIIVATNSPTFTRTREVSRSRAHSILRSTSELEILAQIKEIVETL